MRRRRSLIPLIAACALAAFAPFAVSRSPQANRAEEFGAWPTHFENRLLTPLPLSAREERFAEDFPGRIGRFTDGEREIIIRYVTEATRRLHSSADCFAAIGYRIEPQSVRVDSNGARWGCFVATRGEESLRVYERIHDEEGNAWVDVSEWYWATVLRGETRGAWWAITIAERNMPE